MPDFEFEIDKVKFDALLNRLKKLKFTERAGVVFKGMLHATNLVERQLKVNLTNNILNVRTGHLRRSIGSRVFVSNNGIIGEVGSGVRTGERMSYANIHETGGVLKPSRSKYLTVPLPSALTASGAPKRPNARSWDKTFIIKSKGGSLLIVRRQGKKGIVPLYVLKKSVKIPARKYLSLTMRQMQKRVLVVLGVHIEQGLQNG